MGEATYYFRSIFPSKEQARKSLPKIRRYLKEHQKAYDEWQRVRGKPTKGFEVYIKERDGCSNCQNRLRCLTNSIEANAKCRYEYLKETYPLAFRFIPTPHFDQALNDLAGWLLDYEPDFGILERDKNEIRFSQEVWHFDNWEHLEKFARSLGGKGGYISDEYVETDYYNLIEVR